MENLNCVSGKFVGISCRTQGEFKDQTCDGSYRELVCLDGGNFRSNCSKADSTNKVVSCVGKFEKGKCTPTKVDEFNIIQVSGKTWIKGTCSSKIAQGKCEGTFNQATFVACEGDALHDRKAFDSCKPISGRVFGECVGTLSTAGCAGRYTHNIVLGTFGPTKVVAENTVYNFETISTPIQFVISKAIAPRNRFERIQCEAGLNPNTLECPKGSYNKFFEDSKGEASNEYKSLSCHGILDLKTLTCLKDYSVLEVCKGGIFQKTHEDPIGCLGAYQFANCTTGGGLTNTCTVPNLSDLVETCSDDFFNGSICYSNFPIDYTQTPAKSAAKSDIQEDGHDYKKTTFQFEKVTLSGGSYVESQSIEGGIIPELSYTMFTNKSTADGGSLEDLRNTNFTQVKFHKIKSSIVKFKNLDLDAINLEAIAAENDKNSGNLITIKINTLALVNIVAKNIYSSDVAVSEFKSDQTVAKDIGIKKIGFGISALNLTLPELSFSFPPITTAMIKEWKSKNTLDQTVNIPASPVKRTAFNTFQVVFRRKPDGEIYPFLRLTDLTIETPKDLISNVRVKLQATTPLGTSLHVFKAEPSVAPKLKVEAKAKVAASA